MNKKGNPFSMMRSETFNVILLILASWLVFSLNIGEVEVFMLDESKNASCAREMMERNDLIVPTFNYELRTDKPPLHYFFMITAYKLFGFGEFAARFFSAIFGVLTILLTYLFTRKLFSSRVGLWTSFILLSSLHFAFEFHLAVPDPFLIFFINASLFAFVLFLQSGKRSYLWGMYIAFALGFLTKGPVAVALPALVILAFLLLTSQFTWKKLVKFRLFQGILLFLVIASPWYILVSIKTDMAWTEGFFLKHNLSRYADTMQGHGGIYFLSLIYLLLGMLPFSPLLIQSMIYAFKNRSKQVYYFLFLYIVVFTIFFSLSETQLPNYIMPTFPACAVLIAAFIAHAGKREYHRYKVGAGLWIGLVISLFLPVGLYFGVQFDASLYGMNYLAYYLIPLPLGFIVAITLFCRARFQKAFIWLGASFLLVNILLHSFMLPAVSQKSIAKEFVSSLKENYELISYKRMNTSFVFYYRQEIPMYHDLQELEKKLNTMEKGYIISRKNYKEVLLSSFPDLKVEQESKDLFEGHTTLILQKN